LGEPPALSSLWSDFGGRRAIRYITRITASPLRTMVRLRVVSLLSLSLRCGCALRLCVRF
jgi:hypothetical protein